MTDVYEFSEFDRRNLIYNFSVMTPQDIEVAREKLKKAEEEAAAKKAAAAAAAAAAQAAAPLAPTSAAASKPATEPPPQQSNKPAPGSPDQSGKPS